MSLLRDVQEQRNPEVDTRIEVPTFNVAQAAPAPAPQPTSVAPAGVGVGVAGTQQPEDKGQAYDAAMQVLAANVQNVATPTEAPEGFLENMGPHDQNVVNRLTQVGASTVYRDYRDNIIRQRQWQTQRAMQDQEADLYRPDIFGRLPQPNFEQVGPAADEGDGLTDDLFMKLSGQIQGAGPIGMSQADDFQLFSGDQRSQRLSLEQQDRILQNRSLNVNVSPVERDRTWAERVFGFLPRLMGAGENARPYVEPTNEFGRLRERAEQVFGQAFVAPSVLGGALNQGLAHLMVNAPIVGDLLVPPEQKEQFLESVFYNTTHNLAALTSAGMGTERLSSQRDTFLNQVLSDITPDPSTEAPFSPLQGQWGEAGRGVGGFTIYAMQTPGDVIRAFGQDLFEAAVPQPLSGRQRQGVGVGNSAPEQPFALDHVVQALSGTEHSFMSPARNNGRGMAWTPITQGEQGINLPGGTDEPEILRWLPGSATALGFVLDAVSEGGAGKLFDELAGLTSRAANDVNTRTARANLPTLQQLRASDPVATSAIRVNSQPSLTELQRSLLPPAQQGIPTVLRNEMGNIVNPDETIRATLRMEDLVPVTQLQQNVLVEDVRQSIGGSLVPVNRTTSNRAAEVLHAQADLDLLSAQRRQLENFEEQLRIQNEADLEAVRLTYQTQRQPLNVGSHLGGTRAQRVHVVVEQSPLQQLYNERQLQDPGPLTIDVEAYEIYDTQPVLEAGLDVNETTVQDAAVQANAGMAEDATAVQAGNVDQNYQVVGDKPPSGETDYLNNYQVDDTAPPTGETVPPEPTAPRPVAPTEPETPAYQVVTDLPPLGENEYYLPTREVNFSPVPTLVSPTSPTGNGFDLVQDPVAARSMAEAQLPPDTLLRGPVSERGRVRVVRFKPENPYDMYSRVDDGLAAEIRRYLDDTFGSRTVSAQSPAVAGIIDPNNMSMREMRKWAKDNAVTVPPKTKRPQLTQLIQEELLRDVGVRESGPYASVMNSKTLAGAMEQFDQLMRERFPEQAAAESQAFRNIIDRFLMDNDYDAKVRDKVTTPLVPIGQDPPKKMVAKPEPLKPEVTPRPDKNPGRPLENNPTNPDDLVPEEIFYETKVALIKRAQREGVNLPGNLNTRKDVERYMRDHYLGKHDVPDKLKRNTKPTPQPEVKPDEQLSQFEKEMQAHEENFKKLREEAEALRAELGDEATARTMAMLDEMEQSLKNTREVVESKQPVKPRNAKLDGVEVGTGTRFEQAAALQEVASIYGDASTKADAAKARLEANRIAKEALGDAKAKNRQATIDAIQKRVDAEAKLRAELEELDRLERTEAMEFNAMDDLEEVLDYHYVDTADFSNWECL